MANEKTDPAFQLYDVSIIFKSNTLRVVFSKAMLNRVLELYRDYIASGKPCIKSLITGEGYLLDMSDCIGIFGSPYNNYHEKAMKSIEKMGQTFQKDIGGDEPWRDSLKDDDEDKDME